MTLFMLDIKYLKKQTIFYLIISIFCFIFSYVYHMFSHGVYSKVMANAYLVPLLFGFGLSLILSFFKKIKINRITVNLYNASLGTFTIYLIFSGVLEIYGTTNDLINLYLYIGVILAVLSLISLFSLKKS